MTIWISQELPLFNFERLDKLWAWIRRSSEKLGPFEFLKSFRCSISSVSIYYAPESELRVKSYDHFEFRESFRCSISSVSIYFAPESELRVKSYYHLNFSRTSVVQFRASLYVMRLNRTSVLKVMCIWISRELRLFNFKRLDILCAWIWPSREKLWPFFISRELLLCNFERLDIFCAWIWSPCEKLLPFEFLENFCCSISSISICDAPESDLCVKSNVHLNFSRASVDQFQATRYIMRLNLTSVWKVMTIWIFRELPLINFERLDILCAWI